MGSIEIDFKDTFSAKDDAITPLRLCREQLAQSLERLTDAAAVSATTFTVAFDRN